MVREMIEEVGKISNIFGKATGISCTAIDLNLEDEIGQRKYNNFCDICSMKQVDRMLSLQCCNLHRYASYQAEKWGGKYEYLCPAGATFIATSFLGNNENTYGVIAGPFLMVDNVEFIDDDLDRFFKGDIPKTVTEKAKSLPYIECSRVAYLADILYYFVAYVSERNNIDFRIMQNTSNVEEIRSEDSNYSYQIEGEKLLQQYIAQGNKAAAQKIINEILGNIFFCSGGNFERIKARVIELVVILSRAAIQGGASAVEVFGLNEDYLNNIHRFNDVDELNHWLVKILIRFTTIVLTEKGQNYSEIVKSVITYVRANYMNKLYLNDISEHIKYSVSYLSRIFRDEIGESLSAFINRTRIENSKMVLLTSDLPIIEVAYLCGFDDQSYYTKVFKKITGVSPGKYREKRGK
jgi:two-component system response regulator YesN